MLPTDDVAAAEADDTIVVITRLLLLLATIIGTNDRGVVVVMNALQHENIGNNTAAATAARRIRENDLNIVIGTQLILLLLATIAAVGMVVNSRRLTVALRVEVIFIVWDTWHVVTFPGGRILRYGQTRWWASLDLHHPLINA